MCALCLDDDAHHDDHSDPRGGPLKILAPLQAAGRALLLSLRGRLLLGVAAVWGVLCVMLLAFGWQSGSLLVEESNRVHLRYEAELVRNAITQKIEQRLAMLERLADALPSAAPGVLAEGHHEALLTLFEGLALVDADNIIVDNWPTLPGRNGLSIDHRAYARHMRHVQRPHVSDPFIGIVSGKPMVMMLVPVRDAQGRYTGFLGGLVEIERSELFEDFKHLRLGDEGHVVVATASGRLLYHPEQRRGLPGPSRRWTIPASTWPCSAGRATPSARPARAARPSRPIARSGPPNGSWVSTCPSSRPSRPWPASCSASPTAPGGPWACCCR